MPAHHLLHAPGLSTRWILPRLNCCPSEAYHRRTAVPLQGMGTEQFGDLIPWLMETMRSEGSGVERQGAAQVRAPTWSNPALTDLRSGVGAGPGPTVGSGCCMLLSSLPEMCPTRCAQP